MPARDPRKALAARRNARRSIVFSFSQATDRAVPVREARAIVLGRVGRPCPVPEPVAPTRVDEQALVEQTLDQYREELEHSAARYATDEAEWVRTVHRLAFDERVNASSVHEACAAAGTPIDSRFKRAVGLGVRAYLERVRLRAARVLIAQNEVALQTVALAVGYANYETFNRAVKRRFGCSPSQLRNDAETAAKRQARAQGASKNEALLDVLQCGENVKADRQPSGARATRGWSRTGKSPVRRRLRGQEGPTTPTSLPQPPGLMTITDVKGYPTDDGGVSRIDIEGDSPHLDKLEVTLEVTGKQLKRSVTVRKDRTWTARFKASDGVDLLGFNCGTLVRAGASSKGDEPQHVVWTGCVRCADADADQGGDEAEPAAARSSSDGQPVDKAGQPVEGSAEPLVLVRREEGDGDQAVVTVTVGRQASGAADRQGPRTSRADTTTKRTRRRPARTEHGDRSSEEQHDDEPDGRGGPIERRAQTDSDRRGAGREDRTSTAYQDRPEYEDNREARSEPPRRNPGARGSLDEERRRDRREPRPDRRRGDRQRQDADEEQRDAGRSGREPVSWIKGSLVMIATALLLVAIAAQAYPIMVGLAALITVPTWALVLAGHTPASWARWTASGVGLAALAIPAAMPFVDAIGADVYLVAAGIAALGIAIAAGLLFFRTGDDEEQDDERED